MAKDAAWWRAYRAARGARTGAHGPRPVQPCGTPAGYARHIRRHENVCQPCREAHNADARERYRKGRG